MILSLLKYSCIALINSGSPCENEYFMTLRNDKVNLRQGPSKDYPIKFFYKKIEIILLSAVFS